MPGRSKIAGLAEDVRQNLHVRVIHSGFSDYEGHAEWLKSQGHDISSVAIWRYFRPIKEESQRQIASLAAASVSAEVFAALAKESGETISLATEYVLQRKGLDKLLQALEEGDLSMEDLLRFQEMSRVQRLTSLRAERERGLRGRGGGATAGEDASSDAGKAPADGGDPMEVIRYIRRNVYGIVDE